MKNMNQKGFLHILEAFLAILVIYTVLNTAQSNLPARYSDPADTPRLQRNALDFANAACGNENYRGYFVNNSLPVATGLNLNLSFPADQDFHFYLFSNNTADGKLDDLVNESGSSVPSGVDASTGRTVATASCIISGLVSYDGSGSKIVVYAPKKIVVAVWNR